MEEEEIMEWVSARPDRDPRWEKLMDYRSGGHRKWPSLFSGRYRRTGWGNYLQTMGNRKIRRVSIIDRHGEGIVPINRKTVDWDLISR